MAPNKKRLYVVLSARSGTARMPGGEDKYHWALLVSPKEETSTGCGTRLHAKNVIRMDGSLQWVYEEASVPLTVTHASLVRIRLSKIADEDRLLECARDVPIRHGEPGWNCVSWIREALMRLKEAKGILGTGTVGWEIVRDTAMRYVNSKTGQGRFRGDGPWNPSQIATFDLMKGEETTA